MSDTLESVMERKGLTRYQLSKISGIPWSTLSNICTGKTDFEKCTVGTVRKLANALDLTIEETLENIRINQYEPVSRTDYRGTGQAPPFQIPLR